jgi:hypothetical protein
MCVLGMTYVRPETAGWVVEAVGGWNLERALQSAKLKYSRSHWHVKIRVRSARFIMVASTKADKRRKSEVNSSRVKQRACVCRWSMVTT